MKKILISLALVIFMAANAFAADKWYNSQYDVSAVKLNSDGSVSVSVSYGVKTWIRTSTADNQNNKKLLAIALTALTADRKVKICLDGLTLISLSVQ